MTRILPNNSDVIHGFVLSLETYCANCPNFVAHTEKYIRESRSYDEPDSSNYIIYCEHKDMCSNIYKRILEKEKGEEKNVTSNH